MQTEKEEIKLSLFTDGLIVYVENPKESTITTKILEITSNYNEIAGYKVNIQESVLSL